MTPQGWRLSGFGDEIAPELERQLEVLSSTDVRALEFRSAWGVNVLDLSTEQLGFAAAHLDRTGVAVSAVASPVGKAPVKGSLEMELGRLGAALDAAEALGTRLVRVFSFYVDGRPDEHRDQVLRAMAEFARRASRRGMVLVHENESYIFGDTAERCRDLVESVGSSSLRVAFDPANFVQVGERPYTEAWPILRDHVEHLHVKDAVKLDRSGYGPYPARVPDDVLMNSIRLPGEGDGELRPLLVELASGGFDGYLTLEPHLGATLPTVDGAARFTAAVTALRRLLEEC
jgi:sugar phosphate isomerase/epimerase